MPCASSGGEGAPGDPAPGMELPADAVPPCHLVPSPLLPRLRVFRLGSALSRGRTRRSGGAIAPRPLNWQLDIPQPARRDLSRPLRPASQCATYRGRGGGGEGSRVLAPARGQPVPVPGDRPGAGAQHPPCDVPAAQPRLLVRGGGDNQHPVGGAQDPHGQGQGASRGEKWGKKAPLSAPGAFWDPDTPMPRPGASSRLSSTSPMLQGVSHPAPQDRSSVSPAPFLHPTVSSLPAPLHATIAPFPTVLGWLQPPPPPQGGDMTLVAGSRRWVNPAAPSRCGEMLWAGWDPPAQRSSTSPEVPPPSRGHYKGQSVPACRGQSPARREPRAGTLPG